ncbi:kinesin-like protein KIF13B isoform X11 [Bombus affinis]|uniref:Kinesin-like protein KIF13B isoform X8 n=1 Tax=Bombus terrestris TaxID=30195 RepID=A0A9B2JS76_BOMTE|nr:kinesin-like protein KIF13B isoform X8 [Bombus terrestris]XP_050598602.1 kinesin-like protein KIF13B isoform X11 [Bombus affinis]
MATDKIKVAVRVRPFNRRELELGTQCVVEMSGQQTILQHPTTMDKIERSKPKTFAFDHCFYSLDPAVENFANQDVVFDALGRDILDNAFQGYNACIFAYGQTGSGKSYTMMGSGENKGIIPRLCDNLFDMIAKQQSSELTYKVEVSYMEIYNEKVHDLLDPKPNKQSLKVREHNVLGPYVDGLSQLAVTSFQDIDNLMAEGNKSRTVAATNMNSESSRSHAVFSVILTQTLTDSKSGVSGEKVSRMSLVDLAGSERAVKTGAVGDRLKEGSNINKSLTTLGLVISKLADQNSGNNKNKDKFVPYRDSVLTWLLKDNLGGNSKTVMVATISPAADNYEETLSTLRYADRAKRIVNHAVVNEDPNARIIRELRQEVEALKEMLLHATGQGSIVGQQRTDITEKLSESERLMKEMSQTWEEKLVKTERLQHERQQALEKMGISVQASGIQVEKNKYYLVNLNDDPSLNELLVYYLKERTLVGGRSAKTEQDIQLHGLGILPEHCVITIEETGLYMTPLNGARCFVNGTQVVEKTPLLHGDRIVWGNHHFFRVNCPRSATAINSEPQTPAQNIDYTFAREELMLNELSNDPIQRAIARLEKQHEEDKQVALEKQRQEYERQFQQLRNILSPSTPYSPYVPYDPLRGSQSSKLPACTPTTQMRVEKWAQERDEMFKRSLGQLKADILKANALVQEANFLAEEMGKQTKFSVTLQIPPNNLSPNRKSVFFQRGAFVSEPAILVKRTNMGSQVWSMEKLENKLVDMRDMYEDRKDPNNCQRLPAIKDEVPGKTQDPFYESQENHNLIGVANIFLEVLFHDVRLDYHTPIISQQGEVAGRLQVEISRISGHFPQDRICEAASESSNDSTSSEPEDYSGSSFITCRVTIKQATGLPLSLSHFVFCQYMFCGHPDPIVVPAIDNSEQLTSNCQIGQRDSLVFKFNHTKDFTVPITEEFIEHCSEGALSIEVWGHRSAGFSRSKPGWEVEQQLAKARSLADRWSELTRKIELWVEIQELNEQGEYSPVDVVVKQDTWTGGIYQLRQGQQRRIQVRVKPVQNSGTLPIICQSILNIAVGSVSVRNRLQIPLDSYQDEDLSILREKWSEALMRRRQYLDQQIQKLINKQDKTEQDIEREQSLVDQWVSLTEERNAVLVPAAGSGIPGAPADWNPPPGMEPHIPVLFLDLNADDLSTHQSGEEVSVTGLNSILPKEHGNKFYNLPIIRRIEKDVCAIAAWDSSIHDNIHLNKVTDANERVFLILKTTVRLSHPAPMDLVLRKRLALNIYKRQSITDRIFKRIVRTDCLTQTGVTYEVVSNIPKASEELEDRESLAQIAASGEDNSLCDGETYIEKYTRGVSAVESILTLDRLRQSVAVKELLQAQGQPLMRKTASVPNFSQVLLPLRRLGRTIMRSDTSMDSLNVTRSESVTDLNTELNGLLHSRRASTGHTRNDENFVSAPAKPFGIASPNMVGGKLGLRMTTLHEETSNTGNQLSTPVHDEDEEKSDADYSEYDSYQAPAKPVKPLTSSRTLDSLVELQSTKINTPSMSSSGYGSQAVSTTNLTSEDSISVKSISVDETPDLEYRNLLDYKKPERMDSSLVEETPEEYMGEVTNALGNLNVMENTCGEEHTRKNLDETGAYMDADIDSPVSSTKSDSDANTNVSRTSSTHCQKKDIPSQGLSNRRKSDMEISQASNSGEDSPLEGSSVVHTKLPPGKVVRRRKASTSTGRPTSSQHRASFPMVRPQVSESKAAARLEQSMQPNIPYENGDNSSSERIDDDVSDKSSAFGSRHDLSRVETPLPDWVIVGESVLVRPYSYSGVIAYVGPTEFASGTWIGVELDAPTGKNDGAVNGHRYFTCRPKCGIFVKVDKLIQDKRGRALRNYVSAPQPAPMRRSVSRGEGLHSLHRSRSRGEGLSTTGTRSSPRGK